MKKSLIKEMQTKIEKLEKEIRVLKSKEREFKKLEAQLQQAQKMEALATLAGGIAHDFNNILQTIMGNTQLLLMGKDKGDPDYKKLTQLEMAANKGSELTKHFLTLGKKIESKFSPHDLNRLIKEIKKLLGRTIPKMIEIELQLASDLKMVNVDRGQIEQIVMNLSINARDAMPDGGKLIFNTQNVILNSDEYTKFLHESREYVLLSISDTGSGMSTEEIRHIFEPYYTTKEPGKGTGLGLAMVYAIVKNHRGSIDCLSKPGEGTTFNIYFPVTNSNNRYSKAEEEKGEKEILNGAETILLVDDERAILETGKEMLERYGYHIITAENGEEAISKYSHASVNLVVLDIGMPGMGGLKCLNKLLTINNKAKIIISSGYSMNGRINEALESGAKAFVAKPYRLKEILKTVRKVLDT
jgi:two-component system cell cycle sensor histidine kinase/response regulator CckA